MNIGRSLLASCALFAMTPLTAQIIFPPAVMQAPVAVSPGGGLHVYDFNSPNMSFVWNQYPFLAGPGTRLPTHFILCLRRIAESNCGHANALMNLPPGSITSSVIRSPAIFTPIGMRYTHTPVLPEDRLDTLVRWQVGACVTLDDASCKFTSNTWITLATMEVQAVSISANASGDLYEVSGSARNLGSRATREFTAQLDTWEAIYDAATEDCLKNPNDARVRNDNLVYVADIRGSTTRLVSLPRDGAGNYIATGIIGMYRLGNQHWNSTPFTELTLPPTAGMMPPLPRTPVGTYEIGVPRNSYPRAFLHTLLVDYPGVIDEANETNNSIAECEALL